MKDLRSNKDKFFNLNYVIRDNKRVYFNLFREDIVVEEGEVVFQDNSYEYNGNDVFTYVGEELRPYLTKNGYLPNDTPYWFLDYMFQVMNVEEKNLDFSWMLNSEIEKLEEFRSSAYGSITCKELEALKNWFIYHRDDPRFTIDLFSNEFYFFYVGIADKDLIKRIKNLEINLCYNQDVFLLLSYLRIEGSSDEEVMKRYLGSKYGRWVELMDLKGGSFVSPLLFKILSEKFLEKMDFNYWDCDMTVKSLIRAGIPLRYLVNPEQSKHLTNKELHRYLELYHLNPNNDPTDHMVQMLGAGTGHYRMSDTVLRNILGIPDDERIQSLFAYADTVLKLKWGIRNVKRLMGVREVVVNGRAKGIFYNHRVLNYITDEMLDRGEFTGWWRMMDVIEPMVILETLGIEVDLPIFPKKITDRRIVQLTTSHQLREEGERMDHCVGGYVSRCVNGEAFIFHVHTEINKLGATVEVVKTLDGGYYINQSMGAHNVPNDEATMIMMPFVYGIGG